MKKQQLKTQQLMIGDWVLHEGEPYQIRQLGIFGENRDGDDYPAVCIGKPKGIGLIIERNEITPIPLTDEILEKNGWIKHEVLLNGNKYMFGGDGVLPLLLKHTNQKKYPGFYDNQITIKYVHEFQHWAKLCGIEKDIEI